MKRAEEERYELVLADGRPVLFTNSRLDRDSIPDGLECYDVRHSDSCDGVACEIKPYVLVNHWGTILSKEKFPLEDGSYYPDADLTYLDYGMTLDKFLSKPREEILTEATNRLQKLTELYQQKENEQTGMQQTL